MNMASSFGQSFSPWFLVRIIERVLLVFVLEYLKVGLIQGYGEEGLFIHTQTLLWVDTIYWHVFDTERQREREREREPLISLERKGRKGKKSCIQIQFDHDHKKKSNLMYWLANFKLTKSHIFIEITVSSGILPCVCTRLCITILLVDFPCLIWFSGSWSPDFNHTKIEI